RNIISGNTVAGIDVGATLRATTIQNLVQGNYIGTDVTGNGHLGNGLTSFFDDNAGIVIPANATADRIIQNRIAFDHGAGVRLTNPPNTSDSPGLKIQITENEIYGNEGLGIDLGNAGITPNDNKDLDTGPNNLQNFPVLTSAVRIPRPPIISGSNSLEGNQTVPDPIGAESLTINGTLNSTPNSTFTVHWYFSADAQCTNNEEATVPLAFGKLPGVGPTDINGNATFSFPFDFPIGVSSGVINCTATDADGNTSEFSSCLSPPVTHPNKCWCRSSMNRTPKELKTSPSPSAIPRE